MKRICRATDLPRGARIVGGSHNDAIIRSVNIHYEAGVMFVTVGTTCGDLVVKGFEMLEIDEDTPERIARLRWARAVLDMS